MEDFVIITCLLFVSMLLVGVCIRHNRKTRDYKNLYLKYKSVQSQMFKYRQLYEIEKRKGETN